MRAYGLTYDTGFTSGDGTTHEPFDPEVVRHEMRVIREELYCDAVRVTGGIQDRLETAARAAAEAGLEVWYCPFTNGLTREELLAFLADGAERAERLRREGAEVVFLTGSEISLFTHGFLPGGTLDERIALLKDPSRARAVLPALHTAVNAFLAEAVGAVRARFGGRVSYASLPMEGVDWAPFDIVSSDAGYRDATTPPDFRERLRVQTGEGTPFAVTEFGCVTYVGAAAVGGRGADVIEWDERSRPVRLKTVLARDEQEQAAYLRELLAIYDEDGVDTAFVNTFVTRTLPTSADPARDFDAASFGIVATPDPAEGPAHAWTRKASFHALAAYGRARRAEGAGRGQ